MLSFIFIPSTSIFIHISNPTLQKMCLGNTSNWNPCTTLPFTPRKPKRSKIRVNRLTRWRRSCKGTEMEIKNLKLYLENRNIIEENAKLRKKALLLHQENQALMLEFQKKFSPSSSNTFLHLLETQ